MTEKKALGAQELIKFAQGMDWGQVVANGGPPCFYVENNKFCGRAKRWQGHCVAGFHNFISLPQLLKAYAASLADSPSPTAPNEELVVDLARELYDCFVMGGMEPQDAYPGIRELLNAYNLGAASGPSLREKEPEWILTKDRMPEKQGEYWVWLVPHKPQPSSMEPGDSIFTDFKPYARKIKTYMSREGKLRFNCGATEFPEYWRRLPAPPKTEASK
jgi:hypothetical protein